jgi:hypothetical protein
MVSVMQPMRRDKHQLYCDDVGLLPQHCEEKQISFKVKQGNT